MIEGSNFKLLCSDHNQSLSIQLVQSKSTYMHNFNVWPFKFLPNPKGQGCAYGKPFCLQNVLLFFPFNLISNMAFFRKMFMVSQIYPSELHLNKANTSDTEAVF